MEPTTSEVEFAGKEMLSKLDEAIWKYAHPLFSRGFQATGQTHDASHGYAERIYVLDHVIVKATYERGLAYLEIGCALQPERLVDASGFRDLIDPPAQGRWNLGMGAAAFIDAHWERVYDLLRPSNWVQTHQQIAAFRQIGAWPTIAKVTP